MAGLAKRDQVIKLICVLPVAIKIAPRNDMVNIKGPIKLVFSNTAFLANMLVTLTGCLALFAPIWATPLFMTTLPIAMVLTLLPCGSTLIRTKVPSILSALNYMGAHFNNASTPETGKQSSASFLATFPRACVLVRVRRNNFKFATTDRTHFLNALSSACMNAFIRAKTINTIFTLRKRFAARLANDKRWHFLNRFTKANKRAIFLCWPMGFEIRPANSAMAFR